MSAWAGVRQERDPELGEDRVGVASSRCFSVGFKGQRACARVAHNALVITSSIPARP